MVQLFQSLITPNDVVADIGANIGLTAILFSSLAKKTFAFEPSPSTYRFLSKNLALNKINNVETINCGLGEEKQTLSITFAKTNRSGGFVSNKFRIETGHVTEEIQIDFIDNFFLGKKELPTFIKIDVEGFELDVIKGGLKFLQANQPIVVMEMNHFCLGVLQRITIPDFLDFMRSCFPYLYAVDADNSCIADMHIHDHAYMVMHEHVVKNRFPNLVGGFDLKIKSKLNGLLERGAVNAVKLFETPRLRKPKGKLVALAFTNRVSKNEHFEVTVTVANESDEIWYGYGSHPVLLSFHWQYKDGSNLSYENPRTKLLTSTIAPYKTVEQKILVIAPSEKGEFRLILTLVQEGVFWFEDKGFVYAVLDIAVT